MKITKRLYEQTCIALDLGYMNVIISKSKREFRNGQAKGPGFYIISLETIKKNFQNECKYSFGHFLTQYETVKLDNVNIKYSDLMRLKQFNEITPPEEKQIPSLYYYSTNLTEACENNWWFLDMDNEPHYIFVDWKRFPGVFTHHLKKGKFFYRDTTNNISIETNDLENLRRLVKEQC